MPLISITTACYVIYIVTSLLDTPFIYIAKLIAKKQEAKSSTVEPSESTK